MGMKVVERRVEEKRTDTVRMKGGKEAAVFSTSLLAEASVTLSGLLDPHGNKKSTFARNAFINTL